MSIVAFSEKRMFFWPVICICEKCGERIIVDDILSELASVKIYKCSNCGSKLLRDKKNKKL